MPDFDSLDLKSHIISCTQETFETMLSMDVSVSEAQPPEPAGGSRMVGTLSFAGNISGSVGVQITTDFGFQMAAAMPGSEAEDVHSIDEVKNLLAEITEIVGGNVKSAANDAGFACVISAPAITLGTDFAIASANMERYERYIFTHGADTVVVEVELKCREVSEDGAGFGTADLSARLHNVDVQKVKSLDYAGKIEKSMIETFDTMIAMDLHPADQISAASPEGLRNMASVCFGGDATGIVNIQVSDEFSRIMAASMLGMKPEEIEGQEEIIDLLAEVSNIVGGSLKSALSDAGLDCALSTPSITTGADFGVELMGLERRERFAFKHDAHTVFVEMGINIPDLAKAGDQSRKEVQPDLSGHDAPVPETEGTPRTAEPAAAASADIGVAEPPPAEPEAEESMQAADDFNLELLLDIPLEITVELGRTRIQIRDLLKIEPGSAIKLSRLEGEPVDILANDTLIAKGEVVVQNEKYGIRITEITSRMDRIRNLR